MYLHVDITNQFYLFNFNIYLLLINYLSLFKRHYKKKLSLENL